MNRPLLLSLAPLSIRGSLFNRLYRKTDPKWRSLYADAKLHFAPTISMELVQGDHISDSIAFLGYYEHGLSKEVASLAKKGGLLIDVGANLGYFSLLWAACNSANKCIAFEAAPRNVEIIERNISRNRLENQITLIPKAASNVAGSMPFDLGPDEQTGWGGLAKQSTPRSIDVEVVRVDDMIPPETSVALLKVDIEGADAWALMGCEKLLRNKSISEIWFEQNKVRIRELGIPESLGQDFLETVGYHSMPVGDTNAGLVEWKARPS